MAAAETDSNANANANANAKARVLIIGCGGVGTMCAYNLEVGGKASVTAVLRSNFAAVEQNGFSIKSIEHGEVEGWRPSESKSNKFYFSPSQLSEKITSTIYT